MAFFRMSRSWRRISFSRRSRFSSAVTSPSAAEGSTACRSRLRPIQRTSLDRPIPRITGDLALRPPAGLHQAERFLCKFLRKPSLLRHRVPHSSQGTLHLSEASPATGASCTCISRKRARRRVRAASECESGPECRRTCRRSRPARPTPPGSGSASGSFRGSACGCIKRTDTACLSRARRFRRGPWLSYAVVCREPVRPGNPTSAPASPNASRDSARNIARSLRLPMRCSAAIWMGRQRQSG